MRHGEALREGIWAIESPQRVTRIRSAEQGIPDCDTDVVGTNQMRLACDGVTIMRRMTTDHRRCHSLWATLKEVGVTGGTIPNAFCTSVETKNCPDSCEIFFCLVGCK